MRKALLIFVFSIFYFPVFSQIHPKIYTGLQGFYNKAYENNLYGSFEVGAELLKYKFLAPEIGVKYFGGSPNELETLDFETNPPRGIAKFDSRFKAFIFSIGPKMIFGNEEAALVFLPEYNFGNLRAYKRFFSPDGDLYSLSESIDASESVNFWNFSAGIQGDFFDLDNITFSLLVTYSTLDTEQAFKDLQFQNTSENYNAGSKDGIGLTLRAYFDIF